LREGDPIPDELTKEQRKIAEKVIDDEQKLGELIDNRQRAKAALEERQNELNDLVHQVEAAEAELDTFNHHWFQEHSERAVPVDQQPRYLELRGAFVELLNKLNQQYAIVEAARTQVTQALGVELG
jgi:multidrug resistance efflux pump